MIAVDASLFCYAANRFAAEHSRAAELLEGLANGDRPWAVPWPAAHEFVARVTHPHGVARALRASEAWGFLDDLAHAPTLRWLAPTERHLAVALELVTQLGPAGPSEAAGFEIAVLLREHGVREVLSSDRGLRRFRFLDVRDPIHGELWEPAGPPRRRYRTLG